MFLHLSQDRTEYGQELHTSIENPDLVIQKTERATTGTYLYFLV